MDITGVGSREAPETICKLFTTLTYYTMTLGASWRSGSADGIDDAVEQGALNFFDKVLRLRNQLDYQLDKQFRSFLPWKGFGQKPQWRTPEKAEAVYHVANRLDNYSLATRIASETHPVWDRLSNGAKLLHSRNVYQVLGLDLKSPADVIIYWAPPTKSGQVKGGTNTAVQIARKRGIPELNAFDPKVEEFLVRFVNEEYSLKQLVDFAKSLIV